jgi:hypothetical protein
LRTFHWNVHFLNCLGNNLQLTGIETLVLVLTLGRMLRTPEASRQQPSRTKSSRQEITGRWCIT